jgi:mono/diheme cytochrome c family protein
MSEEHSSNNKSGGVSLLGNLLAIGIPALMILMLGITGIYFVSAIFKGDNKEVAKTEEAAAAPAAKASADKPAAKPAAASADKKAAAPAAKAGGKDLMALGKTTFGTCSACHGMDGTGLKVGPMLMAPSLAGSEIVTGDPNRLALVILKGIKKEDAKFMGVMTPLGAMLDDEKLAAVMTYTRASFGNKASPVTVAEAKKAKDSFASITDPTGVSRAKIDEITAAHK